MAEGEQQTGQEPEQEPIEEPKQDAKRTGWNGRHTIPIQMF